MAMAIRSLKIMLRFDWQNGTVSRLWDGAGPYVDPDLNVWRGASLITGLDAIEQAINGEASSVAFQLSGVPPETADAAWELHQSGVLVDAVVRVLIQGCDEHDQPSGSVRTLWTGRLDNVVFEDAVQGKSALSQVTVICVNKFSFRRQPNGAVLSDADQRARSAILNPGANPDRFAERVVLLQNRTVNWPRFSG